MGPRHPPTSAGPFPTWTQSPVDVSSVPPTSDQVLKTCAPVPTVIETLFNSYPQLRVSESWREVIPEEVFQVRVRPSFPLSTASLGFCSPACACVCMCVCVCVCFLTLYPGKRKASKKDREGKVEVYLGTQQSPRSLSIKKL